MWYDCLWKTAIQIEKKHLQVAVIFHFKLYNTLQVKERHSISVKFEFKLNHCQKFWFTYHFLICWYTTVEFSTYLSNDTSQSLQPINTPKILHLLMHYHSVFLTLNPQHSRLCAIEKFHRSNVKGCVNCCKEKQNISPKSWPVIFCHKV